MTEFAKHPGVFIIKLVTLCIFVLLPIGCIRASEHGSATNEITATISATTEDLQLTATFTSTPTPTVLATPTPTVSVTPRPTPTATKNAATNTPMAVLTPVIIAPLMQIRCDYCRQICLQDPGSWRCQVCNLTCISPP